MLKRFVALMLVGIVSSQATLAAPKIYFENEGHFFDVVTDGKTKVKPSFSGAYDIKDLVRDNPTSLKYAELQERYASKGSLMSIISMTLLTGGLIWGIVNANNGRPVNELAIWLTTLGSSGAFGLIGSHYRAKARHALVRSINTYNGVQYPKDDELGVEIGVIPRPDTFALGANIRF